MEGGGARMVAAAAAGKDVYDAVGNGCQAAKRASESGSGASEAGIDETIPMRPLIPLCVPDLTGNEARYLQECITSTFVSSVGPFVSRFEGMLAESAGAVGAVATSSGTSGLHLALMAVGVQPGDLVVLPSFTFIASANAISHCGATPWLFDVTAESWTLDPALLMQRLASDTQERGGRRFHHATGRRVAAVMPVDTLGSPADMDAIAAVAKAYGLPVVADAAAALGSRYRGRPVGQSGADLSVLSFNGNKTATCGGGGAVLGNDPDLIALVRHLSSTARVGRDYDHDRIGFNYRMTNLAAAVGCAQLERLDEFIAAKRRIRAVYDQELVGLPGVSRFPTPDWAEPSCWMSGIVAHASGRHSAPVLREGLLAAGIDARSFWKPVHLQQPYAGAPRTPQPVAEEIWSHIVTLPSSTNLIQEDQSRVIATLKALFA